MGSEGGEGASVVIATPQPTELERLVDSLAFVASQRCLVDSERQASALRRTV